VVAVQHAKMKDMTTHIRLRMTVQECGVKERKTWGPPFYPPVRNKRVHGGCEIGVHAIPTQTYNSYNQNRRNEEQSACVGMQYETSIREATTALWLSLHS
jgi:hypothetical protein